MRTKELGGTLSLFSPWLRAWWQPYSDCRLQTSAGIPDLAKFICTPIL